jgi:F-type H+-transporting ATPase subunit a
MRFLLLVMLAAAAPAAAQAASAAEQAADFITPHITDSHHLELPWFAPPFYKEIELPRWEPIHLAGLEVDLSPTKHVVFLVLAALLCGLTLIAAARAHKRHTHETGTPRGFAAGIEAMVLYLRNEIILPNVGPRGNAFVPFCLTIFFFILFANLLGLLPWGSTATGNISVTATLAIIAFLVIEIGGMRAQGWKYLYTVFYWPHDMSLAMKLPMTVIMTPVEIFGKFTKPFALAIRLFANMTAGHIVVLALISLIFTFQTWLIVPVPIVMAVAIMLLELFVAFLQAFLFMLLTSVFIGQVRAEHH